MVIDLAELRKPGPKSLSYYLAEGRPRNWQPQYPGRRKEGLWKKQVDPKELPPQLRPRLWLFFPLGKIKLRVSGLEDPRLHRR